MARVIATSFAPQSLDAFFSDDRSHHQRRDRIGPPPAEQRIREQAAEQDRREVDAEISLPRVRLHRPAPDSCCDPPLGAGKERHHHQRYGGENDAGKAAFRRFRPKQRFDGVIAHIQGERQKADADDAQSDGLDALTSGLIEINLQPPEQCRPRCDLDRAIEAESDESYASGDETNDDRDQPFEAVIGDSEVFKPAAMPDEFRPIIRMARMICLS